MPNRDIPGRTESPEGWRRSGHIGWGHLWKDLLLFLESLYLEVYSSHWVWLLDSLSSRISKLAWNPNAESRRPFDRDSPQHHDQRPVGKDLRWRRKEPANNRRGYKSFCLNPPTETVRHGQVLSCLPPVSSHYLWKTRSFTWKTSSFPDLSLYSGEFDRARGKLPRGQSKTFVPRYFERRSMAAVGVVISIVSSWRCRAAGE